MPKGPGRRDDDNQRKQNETKKNPGQGGAGAQPPKNTPGIPPDKKP